MRTGYAATVAILVLAASLPVVADDPDRYPVRRLSSSMDQEGFPTWSPDGATIVFEDVDRDHPGLFRVSAGGGDPVRLTSFIAEHPKWSPDGAYLVFDAEFGASVRVMASGGGRPVRIVPESIPVRNGAVPIWSPDGARIAFKSGAAVWVLEIETGALTRVLEAPGKLLVPSCWSRDGGRIVLWTRDDETRASAIWSVEPGGEPRELFPPVEGRTYRYADESPDGSLVAFALCEGRSCDLWAAPAGGGGAVRLTMHPAYDDTPSWSPDGTRIAFTSARSGTMDVYVMDLDLEDLREAVAAAQQ